MKVMIEDDVVDDIEGIFSWIVPHDPTAAAATVDRISNRSNG